METTFIGVATCDYCRTRFRVRPEHAKLEGTEIRCPKCHRTFVLKIERPSLMEQTAIESASTTGTNASNDSSVKEKRLRRTKDEVRRHRITHIKKAARTYIRRLQAVLAQESSSEEEVRRWCIDVLRDVLGYDNADIDTEMRALNQRIDIALKHDDKVFMVIECKNVRSKLPSTVRDQAVMYAVNKSADWAVVTNGQVWKLYRVLPVKGSDPTTIKVFDIGLLDEDGISDDDAESLYLLTSRALFSGESDKLFHRICCLSQRRLLGALTSDRVIRVLRRQLNAAYKSECCQNVKLSDEMVASRLQELFLPPDL